MTSENIRVRCFVVADCSQKLELRAEVVDVFLAKFQLRPEELQILRGTRDGILHPVC